MSDKIVQFIKSLYELCIKNDGNFFFGFIINDKIRDLIPSEKKSCTCYNRFQEQEEIFLEIAKLLSLKEEELPPARLSHVDPDKVREHGLLYDFLFLSGIYHELMDFSEREVDKVDSLIHSLIGEVEKRLKELTDSFFPPKTTEEAIREGLDKLKAIKKMETDREFPHDAHKEFKEIYRTYFYSVPLTPETLKTAIRHYEVINDKSYIHSAGCHSGHHLSEYRRLGKILTDGELMDKYLKSRKTDAESSFEILSFKLEAEEKKSRFLFFVNPDFAIFTALNIFQPIMERALYEKKLNKGKNEISHDEIIRLMREGNKRHLFGYCCTSIVYNDLFDDFVEKYNERHPDSPISRKEFEKIAWSYSHINRRGEFYEKVPFELEDFEEYYQPKNWTKEWQKIIKKNFPNM